MKPIMVNKSMGKPIMRSNATPPTVANGNAAITSRLSTNERNSPLMSKYNTMIASVKLRAMLASAILRSSALP